MKDTSQTYKTMLDLLGPDGLKKLMKIAKAKGMSLNECVADSIRSAMENKEEFVKKADARIKAARQKAAAEKPPVEIYLEKKSKPKRRW